VAAGLNLDKLDVKSPLQSTALQSEYRSHGDSGIEKRAQEVRGHEVIHGIDLEIRDHEFIAFVGHREVVNRPCSA